LYKLTAAEVIDAILEWVRRNGHRVPAKIDGGRVDLDAPTQQFLVTVFEPMDVPVVADDRVSRLPTGGNGMVS
jgi:hypothetical protein